MTYKEYLQNKRPYQEDGHLFLVERKHACLYYKPGKGKTYPCIDAIRDVNDSMNGQAKTLILSTADSVKSMWNAEILPQDILPENTVIMTFNSAIIDKTKSKLLSINWDIIVIDECHKVKSHNAQISKLVFRLTRKCPFVFGLSGTPRGNSDVDIYCQFHNMNIGEWGDISYTNFIDNVCKIEQKFFGRQMIKVPIGIKDEFKSGWERNIAMFTQRADYDEEDEMPEMNVNVVKFPYNPTKEYLSAEQGCIQVGDYENTMTKLSAICKLHQAANGFLYIPKDNGNNDIHRFEKNIKTDWINKNIIPRVPTVIVYRFMADLLDLKERLKYNMVTESIYEYKNWCDKLPVTDIQDTPILLLQCSRCESFNLQECSHMIFYTMDYSFIKYNQMLHRIWRKGQVQNVLIDILLFENTIEEKIWKTVKNKETLSQLFYSIKEL